MVAQLQTMLDALNALAQFSDGLQMVGMGGKVVGIAPFGAGNVPLNACLPFLEQPRIVKQPLQHDAHHRQIDVSHD